MFKKNYLFLFVCCIGINNYSINNKLFSLKKQCYAVCQQFNSVQKEELLSKLTDFNIAIKKKEPEYINWHTWYPGFILSEPVVDLFKEDCSWYITKKMFLEEVALHELDACRKYGDDNEITQRIARHHALARENIGATIAWETLCKWNLEAYAETIKMLVCTLNDFKLFERTNDDDNKELLGQLIDLLGKPYKNIVEQFQKAFQ